MSTAFPGETVVVIRHADALSRKRWLDDDALRPLSKRGECQAHGLADQLGTRANWVLLSSRFLRCIQTLEPLAKSQGLTIEQVAYLGEGADPQLALNCVIGLIYNNDVQRTVVACSHGDVLIGIAALLGDKGVAILDEDVGIEKGGRLELNCRSGDVFAARYVPAP